METKQLPTGESAVIITGGVIITVRGAAGIGILDIEANQVVIFTRTLNPQELLNSMRQPGGNGKGDLEMYLAGGVEIRETSPPDPKNPGASNNKILRANEVYYDVNRNVAIAVQATLEMNSDLKQQGTNLPIFTDPVFIKAKEILRLSETKFQAHEADLYSSKLPADPGLKIYVTTADIVDSTRPKLNFLGKPVLDRKTGQPIEEKVTTVTATDVYFEIEDIPFFYLPYLQTNARDPLGPTNNILMGYNRIFGFSGGISFNVFKLLGIEKPPNHRIRLDLDYLSRRGPASALRWDYGKDNLFGIPATISGMARGYIIYDQATDILGGNRFTNDPPNYPAFNPSGVRGRLMWQESIFDLPEGFTVQGQLYYLSDRNFQEQYFKNEFDNGQAPQTFLYGKQSPIDTNWAWTLFTDAHLRSWITESVWLPKLDGYLIGASPLDNLLTYNAHASAGYNQFRVSTDPEPQVSPTDVATNTSRLDFMQELAMPIQLGDVKFVPYIMGDLTQYSSDINGNEVGRVWGAAGARATLPMSRLYSDIHSELLNVNGINHKIVFGANAFFSRTDVPYQNLPQLDRLNDDATDMALRDIRPNFPSLYPSNATTLLSPLFDPQTYAVRNLVLSQVDTLASTEVVQFDIRQRWQTKRGYPGLEHIIDWMTLDLYASFFPRANQDDFGKYISLLQYDWLWNIGDRTALTSSGWYDPIPGGARMFNIGATVSRPDRTSFYLGYREIDTLESKAVTASMTYIFSPKYALTAGITYDFGAVPVLAETLVLTRIGADIQVSLGLSYNNLQNNFGLVFEIVPNLAANSRRNMGVSGVSAAGLASGQFNTNQ